MVWDLLSGEYKVGNEKGCVAVLTLNSEMNFDSPLVAISGKIMTENLGVTRVLTNVLSNPNIRYLIICGKEVGGHFPGNAMVSFYEKGYDLSDLGSITIKNTKAADPRLPIEPDFIEEVHSRFKKQITLIDLIGETNENTVLTRIKECSQYTSKPLKQPYIVKLKKTGGNHLSIEDDVALHSKIRISNFIVYKR